MKQKWNSEELADRYQREYAIDVRPYLSEQEVTLERDATSGAWMFRGGTPGDGPFYERLHSRDEYYLQEKWEFGEAMRCLDGLAKEARLLEIGCGTGAFLDRCRDAGFNQVRGLELNQRARQACRDKGHDVRDELMEQMVASSRVPRCRLCVSGVGACPRSHRIPPRCGQAGPARGQIDPQHPKR